VQKQCINCSTTQTSKWFSGPLCRKCYRQQPNIRNKELQTMTTYRGKNRTKILAKKAEWRSHNLNYDNDRCKVDPIFKLKKRLRTRLNHALFNNWKTGSAVNDLGCSIEELKQYLESQFTFGMSWDNYGKWHIDHIKPLAMFDLSKRDEFLIACNYKNLKPLWAVENWSKGARYVSL
jgi:hypothetical protein